MRRLGLAHIKPIAIAGFLFAVSVSAPAAGLGVGTARAADTVINPDPTATNVSAFGGALVWSRQEAPNGKFRLVQHINGVTSDAPLPVRLGPFDADLGPGRRGGIVAVYSRCRGAPAGCDLFQFDLRSGRERKLRRLSTRRCSETAPSIWRGAIAYASAGHEERCTPAVYVVSARRRRLRIWKGKYNEQPESFDTDLRGRTLAFEIKTSGGGPTGGTAIFEARLGRRGRSRRCLLRTHATSSVSGFGGTVRAPVLDGGFLYWTRTEWRISAYNPDARTISGFERVRIGCRGAVQIARRHRTLVGPAGVDSGTLYYTHSDSDPYLGGNRGVLRADDPPLSFAP